MLAGLSSTYTQTYRTFKGQVMSQGPAVANSRIKAKSFAIFSLLLTLGSQLIPQHTPFLLSLTKLVQYFSKGL